MPSPASRSKDAMGEMPGRGKTVKSPPKVWESREGAMRARPLSKDEKSQRWVPRSLADGLAKPPGESSSPSRLSGKLLISQDPSVPLLPSPRGHRLGGRPREEGPRWQTRWIAKPGIWTRGMLSQPLRGLGCLIKGSSVNNTVPQYLQSR